MLFHFLCQLLREKLREFCACYPLRLLTVVVVVGSVPLSETVVCHVMNVGLTLIILDGHREVIVVLTERSDAVKGLLLALEKVFLIEDRHAKNLLNYLLESSDSNDWVLKAVALSELQIFPSSHGLKQHLSVSINQLGVINHYSQVSSSLLEDVQHAAHSGLWACVDRCLYNASVLKRKLS